MIKARSGFTLIEILVVIAIMAVLSAVGIAGFVNYSRFTILTSSVSDIVVKLNVAKSRAQSQVIPDPNVCATHRLSGYQVSFNQSQKTYALSAIFTESCTADISYQIGKLPNTVSFESVPATAILFNAVTGGVTGAGDIVVRNDVGSRFRIRVDDVGNISFTKL